MKLILRRLALALLCLTPAVAVAEAIADRADPSCCPGPCCPDCDRCPHR